MTGRFTFMVLSILIVGQLVPSIDARDVARGAAPIIGSRLDLPAMLPTPAEVEPASFSIFTALVETVSDRAASLAAESSSSEEDERTQLDQLGWIQGVRAIYVIPDSAQPDVSANIVGFEVVEYRDSELADAAWAASQEDNSVALFDPQATYLGDFLSVHTIPNVDLWGSTYQARSMVLQVGTIVAVAYLFDLGTTGVPRSRTESLGQVLLARIQDVLADGSPGLHAATVRFSAATGADVVRDTYVIRDGSLFRWQNDTDDGYAEQVANFGSASDGYSYRATFGLESFVSVNLMAFETDDLAAAAFDSQTRRPSTGLDAADSWEQVDDSANFGEESIAVQISGPTYGSIRVYSVVVRIGSQVAIVAVAGPNDPLAMTDAAEQVARLQVECVTLGECSASILERADSLVAAFELAA